MGSRNELAKHDMNLSMIEPRAAYESFNVQQEPIRSIWFFRLIKFFDKKAAKLVILSILLAGFQLCQPLVIQALVNFLNANQHSSIGRWLIVALSFK